MDIKGKELISVKKGILIILAIAGFWESSPHNIVQRVRDKIVFLNKNETLHIDSRQFFSTAHLHRCI